MDDECAVCKMGIISHGIGPMKQLNDAYFHQDCFVCAKCDKPLPADQADHPFVLHNNKVYHDFCSHHLELRFREQPVENPSCGKCRQEIKAGEIDVEAAGNHYHNKCFTCAKCDGSISGDFIRRGGDFLHVQCK